MIFSPFVVAADNVVVSAAAVVLDGEHRPMPFDRAIWEELPSC